MPQEEVFSQNPIRKIDRTIVSANFYKIIADSKKIKKVNRRYDCRFLTLTVNKTDYKEKGVDWLLNGVAKFITNIREKSPCEFIGVTGRDYRHVHLLFGSNYFKQRALSERWYRVTGCRVVDIRRIHDAPGLLEYLDLPGHDGLWIASEKYGQARLTEFMY
jgi:hypothetical protein